MKTFKKTFILMLWGSVLLLIIVILGDIDKYPKFINFSISAFVTCLFLIITSIIGYEISKKNTKMEFYNKFRILNNDFVKFFNCNKPSKQLFYLNKINEDFEELNFCYDNFCFIFKDKTTRKKLCESIIYIQILMNMINYDLNYINNANDNNDYYHRNKYIKNVFDKLNKSFHYNNTYGNIILNDMSGYLYCFKSGINKNYKFKSYPNYKESLKFFIVKEEDDIHKVIIDFEKKYLKLSDEEKFEQRIIYSISKENQNSFEKILKYLKENNYLVDFYNISKSVENIIKNFIPLDYISYDITLSKKIFDYIENLEIINCF